MRPGTKKVVFCVLYVLVVAAVFTLWKLIA